MLSSRHSQEKNYDKEDIYYEKENSCNGTFNGNGTYGYAR